MKIIDAHQRLHYNLGFFSIEHIICICIDQFILKIWVMSSFDLFYAREFLDVV